MHTLDAVAVRFEDAGAEVIEAAQGGAERGLRKSVEKVSEGFLRAGIYGLSGGRFGSFGGWWLAYWGLCSRNCGSERNREEGEVV